RVGCRAGPALPGLDPAVVGEVTKADRRLIGQPVVLRDRDEERIEHQELGLEIRPLPGRGSAALAESEREIDLTRSEAAKAGVRPRLDEGELDRGVLAAELL